MSSTGQARDPRLLTVSTTLGEVSVRVTGRRNRNVPALLLLHANPGDRRDFDAVLPALEQEFTVVAPDWPGYGQSGVTDPARVSAEGLVAVTEQILDALAIERIHRVLVLGNSVGGFVAVQLGLRRPATIVGLVLVDPGGFTPPNVLTRAFCVQVMGRPALARWLITPMARAYLGHLRTDSARATYARAQQVRSDTARLEAHCALWRSFADPNFDLTTTARALEVPTLLIWGRQDPVLPAAIDGRRARRTLPHASTVSLQTGHESFNERPEEFLSHVMPFLRAQLDRVKPGVRGGCDETR